MLTCPHPSLLACSSCSVRFLCQAYVPLRRIRSPTGMVARHFLIDRMTPRSPSRRGPQDPSRSGPAGTGSAIVHSGSGPSWIPLAAVGLVILLLVVRLRGSGGLALLGIALVAGTLGWGAHLPVTEGIRSSSAAWADPVRRALVEPLRTRPALVTLSVLWGHLTVPRRRRQAAPPSGSCGKLGTRSLR